LAAPLTIALFFASGNPCSDHGPTQLTFLASLDFPDGSILRLSQIASSSTARSSTAQRDRCRQAVLRDLKSAKATRRTARVSVEDVSGLRYPEMHRRMDRSWASSTRSRSWTRVELISFLQASLKGRKSA